MPQQLDLFSLPINHIATWTPRDLWLRLDVSVILALQEDSRVERKSGRSVDQHEIQIIGYAFNNGTIQVAEAARITNRQWNSSKRDLDRLVAKGLLKFNAGKMQRDPKAHYSIMTDKVNYDELVG